MAPLDPSISDAEAARRLLASHTQGSLSTHSVAEPGFPFGSVMPFTLDPSGDPILLASRLAEHTTNFMADPRASLMVAEAVHSVGGDPLALQRVTLLGVVVAAAADEVAPLYLDVHPYARQYHNFPDFSFHRLEVRAIRYVGGFGRMSWVELDEYRSQRKGNR